MNDTIREVIITSSNACAIYDAKNGNEVASYKDENTFSPKTLSLIGEDYLIGAYSNKPMLKVWTISKKRKQEMGSFVVPGPVSTLAVSSCGNYCIAGIKDQIFLWEVSTGELVMTLSRHYQAVTCLKFTVDDSRFFSGGKDGHVMVWVLSCVIDVNARQDNIKPQYLWNNHSAEVTDIYCGNTISHVATTSLDMTCKIYDLDSGLLLSSVCMDVPLTSVVMGPLEYYIFLGDEQGCLYRINTYERLPHEIHRADVDKKDILKLHETKITALSVSFNGTQLLTASEDGTCKLWNIQSMACVLNIRFDGGLTNAFLALRPACLDNETVLPQSCVRSFQKDMTSMHNGKKYIESKIGRRELSLMCDGCPDEYFSRSIFCPGTSAKAEETDPASIEENFEEKVHGNKLSELAELNRQLFTMITSSEHPSKIFESRPSSS